MPSPVFSARRFLSHSDASPPLPRSFAWCVFRPLCPPPAFTSARALLRRKDREPIMFLSYKIFSIVGFAHMRRV